MKRLIVAAGIGLGLLAASCAESAGSLGTPGGGSTTPTGTPSVTPTSTPSTAPTGSGPPATSPSPTGTATGGQTMTYEVWFQYGEHLFVTRRTEPFTEAVGRAALTALLEGPAPAEDAAGVGTSIPEGTTLRDLSIEDGTATVDLSEGFEAGGGSASMSMRVAQVVYTITQFPTVESVAFLLEGQPVEAIGGEGIVVDPPVTRAGFDDQLPPILVESPLVGARVGSPLTVSGTANVFEATVSIRILDAEGTVIATTFTTATCGTGCRGDYSVSVRYTVDHEQAGTVEVFESSALDGSAVNLVAIPVVLTG